jgi:hypothetical protein
MVLEREPLSFDAWLATGLPQWLIALAAVALSALLLGFVIAAVRSGPVRAGDAIYRLLAGAVLDLVRLSPRRVLALARLAIQESLRRRVLAGLGVFVVILAFALWFLDAGTQEPVHLYLSFVLTATTWLLLIMMVFLSAFSLPNDIKNHTIYTIVTKPVRPSEIVLGRIVGFAAVGTALLAIMGLLSYLFVVRTLNHTHELSMRDLTGSSSSGAETQERTGRTGTTRNHWHSVVVDADGNAYTDPVQEHWHNVTIEGTGDNARISVGPPQGQFHARVPIYGKLTFMGRDGKPTDKGINVGNEWTYRSYIEGPPGLMAARWNFEGVRREDFPEGLRLNLTLSVFRSHKGDIDKTVLGSYTLRNPRTRLSSRPKNFYAKEFAIDDHTSPLKLEDADGRSIDLFDDLVDQGQLEIEVTCLQSGQYFGMAKPDLYLLPREGSFEANFLKGYAGIWLQMLLVTTFGVMWSTFLNGPVSMLATLMTLIAGQFAPWVQELATGNVIGGNAFEAASRMLTQTSIGSPLDENLATSVVQGLDRLTLPFIQVLASLLPDFSQLDDSSYVAEGFNIPNFLIGEQSLAVLGFLIPLFVVGFLCLKMREVAK